MTSSIKKVIALVIILLGFLLNGFAWSTTIGHPINTISLLLGLILMASGIIWLVKIK